MSLQAESREHGDREGGAALIIVLVFMLAILAMVAYVVPPATKQVEHQAAEARMAQLSIVLQHGFNDAIQEMLSGIDSDGNGIGCVGLPATWSTWTAGQSSYPFGTGTIVTAGGRRLGAYLGVVKNDATDPNIQILHMIAGYPDLSNPAELLAARMRVDVSVQGLFGDRNAISFAGQLIGTSGTGSGNFGWQTSGDQTVKIKSEKKYDTDGDGVDDQYAPAVNISDTNFYNGFLSEFVNDANHGVSAPTPGIYLKGGDENDLANSLITAPPGNAEDTISQNPSSTQRVNESFIAQWIKYWREPGSATPDVTVGAGTADDGATHTYTDKLVYISASQLKSGTKINGSGTLILKGSLTVSGHAEINWTGEVIVMPDGGHGNLKVGEGKVNVNGALVLAPDPTDNKIASLSTDHKEAEVNVTGSLLVIQAGSGSAQVDINKGGSVKVDGLLALLGNSIDVQVVGGATDRSKLNVDGSTVISVPQNGSGLQKLRFDSKSDTVFEFDNAKFENGVGIAESGPSKGDHDIPPPPVTVYKGGYVEVSGGAEWSALNGSTGYMSTILGDSADDPGLQGM
ncbi:MAG: hypothetical protein AB7N76_13800 [Planctomycetota bacterium]